MATSDIYTESTQYKHWKFTKEQLIAQRTSVLDIANSQGSNNNSNQLTLDEESKIRNFYEHKIADLCKILNFPDKVKASAIVYFKRFYLYKSIINFDPKITLVTCVYISCKSEESHVEVDELSKITNIDTMQILQLEMTILHTIKFHLTVFHPYKPYFSFLASIKDLFQLPSTLSQQLWDRGRELIEWALCSDCVFMFPPAQIALAVAKKVSEQYPFDFASFAQKLSGHEGFEVLMQKLPEVLRDVPLSLPYTPEEIRAIQQKLSGMYK